MKKFFLLCFFMITYVSVSVFGAETVLGEDMLIRFSADKIIQGDNLDFIIDFKNSRASVQCKAVPSDIKSLTICFQDQIATYRFPVESKGKNGYNISKSKFDEFKSIILSGKRIAVVVQNNSGTYAKATFEIEDTKLLNLQIARVTNKENRIGSEGPAGGWIFYDCDEDNEFGNYDGLKSSECGWRYLEVTPADVRFINGVGSCDVNDVWYDLADEKYVFGSPRYISRVVDPNNAVDAAGRGGKTGIGEGQRGTERIIASEKRYINTAANLCNSLVYNGYDDWFLPSIEELNLVYENLHKKGIGNFSDVYWSSSNFDYPNMTNIIKSWYQNFINGNTGADNTDRVGRVRAIRAFIE